MLAFLFHFGRTRSKRALRSPHPPKGVRLNVEQLEDHTCPSGGGPHLSLNATVLPGRIVQLAGQVIDATVPQGFTITFAGAASGTAVTDSGGNYNVTMSDASLGSVTAIGIDQANVSTDTASAAIAVNAPSITLSFANSTASTVTLAGTIMGIDAAGRTVTITGVAEGSAETDSSGNFMITLNSSAIGAIDASTVDLWGQVSNTAQVVADIAYYLPANQTLHAGAEVGVLNELGQTGNQLFTVSAITINGSTYAAGETVTLPSLAELAVASDGSLTYSPYASFTGTDSFVVTALLGSKTQTTTVQMIVGDVEESEAQGQFSYTSAGNFEYLSNLPDDSTRSNFVSVPFQLLHQNRRVRFGDLCSRLPEHIVVRDVTLFDNTVVTIRSLVKNFTYAAGLEVHNQVCRVRSDLQRAIANLVFERYNLGDGPGYALPPQLRRWFTGPDYDETYGWQEQVLTDVKAIFQDVATGLDENTTEWRDVLNVNYWGRGDSATGYLEIGPPYHGASATDLDKYGTIIHALSHFYGDTDDKGYFNNPQALQGQPIVWTYQGFPVELQTADLLDNADSFAGYLGQFYYD